LINTAKVKPKSIYQICNPFNFEEIRQKANKKIDLKDDYIICIANFNPVKDHQTLIKA